MLSFLVVLFFVQDPPQTYQPGLVDPGLHGGRILDGIPDIFDDATDVTPDGLIRLGFREHLYDPATGKYLSALYAAVVDTGRIQTDLEGDLSAFYEPDDETGYLADGEFGEDFAFSKVNESKVIYWCPPFVGSDTETLIDDQLEILPLPGQPGPARLNRCIVDPGLPLPAGAASNITIAMLPLPPGPENGENPYPSDPSGAFEIGGSYRTYRLWAVLDDVALEDPMEDELSDLFTCVDGYLAFSPSVPWHLRLVALELKVVVNLTGATPTIQSATIEDKPYEVLTSTEEITGLEPSITADGTLIVYNGGNSELMYVWNPARCTASGWSAPLPVTSFPPSGFAQAHPEEDPEEAFQRRYAFAKYPIHEPDNYPVSEFVPGAYPWVSKDGSFIVAMHVNDTEAEPQQGGRRCGMFVVGDITGGYIKHIDDTALNPTRLGGRMEWPQIAGEVGPFTLNDTGRTTVFSTGLKPGLWEPFLGAGVPVPTQRASERIPILPVFVHRTRQYGEVRFEEADGNYLLYLACNESFDFNGGTPIMRPRQTPDTSCRLLPDGAPARRAVCSLNEGAAFPQELVVQSLPPNHPNPSAQLRQWIGGTIGANVLGTFGGRPIGEELHENVGFKGQGIVMSDAGCVEVVRDTEDPWPDYGDKLTVQAFVKVHAASIPTGGLSLIEDTGNFILWLAADGSLRGQVTSKRNGNWSPETQYEQSPSGVVPFDHDLLNPRVGWHHVAMTYNGSVAKVQQGMTQIFQRVEFFVDGVMVDFDEWEGPGEMGAPSAILVGPGRESEPDAVTLSNAALVIDEVAISSVVRTSDEIRRDAYVEPEESDFEPMPSGQFSVPEGLDLSATYWPKDVDYDADKVALGDALFESPLLSKSVPSPYVRRSCSTCHADGAFFANNEPRATAAQPPQTAELPFNVPTVLNMAFGAHKLFDGSAASLEEQIVHPILGAEMGPQTMSSVLNRIKANEDLTDLFDLAYPPGGNSVVTAPNLKESLAMYLRTQLTGDSPFDLGTLSIAQQRGRALFFGKARCFGCHRGSNFSDDDFHNIGTVQDDEDITVRGGFTKRMTEHGQVKTPTLRNVAETGPWFHDGSVPIGTGPGEGLRGVIEHYNLGFTTTEHIGTLDRQLRPLGLDPNSTEIGDLVAFLESLTGSVPD